MVRADYSEMVREALAEWLAENDTSAAGRRTATAWLKADDAERLAIRRGER